MLNETASSREDHPRQQPVLAADFPGTDPLRDDLRQMVATVLDIKQEVFAEMQDDKDKNRPFLFIGVPGQLVGSFQGNLRLDSEAAYAQLDTLLKARNLLPIFRQAKNEPGELLTNTGQHLVHIIRGRANPPRRAWWPNLLLFIATLFSVLVVGTDLALSQMRDPAQIQAILNNLLPNLWRGLPYAISILLILGAHELGHYFAARRHKLSVTLPYFIPLPFISPFGTLGAFIQLREPMRNRKVLLDVGMAGPLAGLVFAIPILFIGLANTSVIPISHLGGVYEGDSILYATAKILTFGHFLPDGLNDVCIDCNQMAWAGWTGLLITALNLIPVGQLDGGHILYSLIGERARKLYFPAIGIMIALALITQVWVLWVLLMILFGRIYATPLDMVTPLDNRRRWMAVISLVIFVLIFIPTPFAQTTQPAPTPVPGRNSVFVQPFLPPS
ncbi:MAG: site-2 protease family protein [Anaerolineaceae bacterium]|nr:site-2 protease family protein [Anaerolineaceae bacterium]